MKPCSRLRVRYGSHADTRSGPGSRHQAARRLLRPILTRAEGRLGPMPVFAYDRAATQRLILERIEAGWTLARLEAETGFPSAPTIRKWAREDPAFANLLAWARNWRRGLKVERRVLGRAFNPAWAEDF